MLYDDITAIATGHDNTAGLTLVSSLTVEGIAMLPPLTFGGYRRGERRFKANGVPYYSGFKSKTFVSFMTAAQYTYMRETYEGLVTVHSWLEDDQTEYDYNAVLWFEELADHDPVNVATQGIGWSVPNVKWNLSRIEVIP